MNISITLTREDADRLLELKAIDGEQSNRVNNMSVQEYAKELLIEHLRREVPEVITDQLTAREAEELGEIIAEALRDQLDTEEKERRTLGDAIREAIEEDIKADRPTAGEIWDGIRAEVHAEVTAGRDQLTTKERARRKWEEIKADRAQEREAREHEARFNDIVITDTMPDEI